VLLLDINVLLYAHRLEMPMHRPTRAWLEQLITSGDEYAPNEMVLSAFLRLVTNPRVVSIPSTLDEAFTFCRVVRSGSGYTDILPGAQHWETFERLCRTTHASGNRVPDAYLAALALEHGCELVTFDRGFRRYPGLRWSIPTLS